MHERLISIKLLISTLQNAKFFLNSKLTEVKLSLLFAQVIIKLHRYWIAISVQCPSSVANIIDRYLWRMFLNICW